ncbi:hypothetical protein C6A88_00215, partial [Mycolicibacterium austroafricanum]
GAAVWAHAVAAERRYVWVPDATGSLFFLISGALAMMAVTAVTAIIASAPLIRKNSDPVASGTQT